MAKASLNSATENAKSSIEKMGVKRLALIRVSMRAYARAYARANERMRVALSARSLHLLRYQTNILTFGILLFSNPKVERGFSAMCRKSDWQNILAEDTLDLLIQIIIDSQSFEPHIAELIHEGPRHSHTEENVDMKQ